MNKYVSVLKLGLFITLMSIMANAIDSYATSGDVGGSIEESSTSIFSAIKSLWRLLSYQIDGIPVIINTLISVPIAFMVLFLIVDVVKDLVPLT